MAKRNYRKMGAINVGVLSDPHFGHKWMAEKRGFLDVNEYNEEIIKRYNSVTNKRSLVIMPGDITMENKEFIPLIGRLNGRKILVGGNHDTRDLYPLLSEYFESIVGAMKYKGYIITHIPIHEQEVGHFAGNIHGHTHEKNVMKVIYRPMEIKARIVEDNRYFNCSWDILNGYPIEIGKLIENKRKRMKELYGE